MKYFLLKHDFRYGCYNVIEGFGKSGRDLANSFASIYRMDGNLAAAWKAPKLAWAERDPEDQGKLISGIPDFSFVWQGPRQQIISLRAWKAVSSLISSDVEVLPVIGPDNHELLLMHLPFSTDCLDLSRADVRRFQDGKVMRVTEFAFHEDRIAGRHIFRLPLGQGSELVVDEVFKRCVEAHELTGVEFKILRMVGDPPPLRRVVPATPSKHAEMTDLPTLDASPESTLSQWLAHSSEFGCTPKSVRPLHTYHLNIKHHGPTDVHLLAYEMPDGRSGRGFVNPTTWSFLGDKVNLISDDDLLLAYAGWLYAFPALQNGHLVPFSKSDGEEQRLVENKAKEGFFDLTIFERYRLKGMHIFEWRATYQEEPVRGAGNASGLDLWHPASHPRYHLPALYYLFGPSMMVSPPSAAVTPAQG